MKPVTFILAIFCLFLLSSCAVQSFSNFEGSRVNTRSTPRYGAVDHNYTYKAGDLVVNTKTYATFKIDSVQYREPGLKEGFYYYATDVVTGEHVKGLLEKALVPKAKAYPPVTYVSN